MQEIGGTVQWIYHPLVFTLPVYAAFLGKKGVIRIRLTNRFHDNCLGLSVHFGHEIVAPLAVYRHVLDAVNISYNLITSRTSGADSNVQHWMHIILRKQSRAILRATASTVKPAR